MALFTKDSIDRVRDAIDMVELVGAKTDLRRAGTRWQGLCPFHDERTPSFSVNPEDKLYYCFGCQKGGDAIGFVQEVEGLDFPEAVEMLAERYNVRVEREDDDPEADKTQEAAGAAAEPARPHGALLRVVPRERGGGRQGAGLPRRAGLLRGGAEGVPGGLRAERVGQGAGGRPAGRVHDPGARRRGPGPAQRQRQPLRPLPGADHVPARGRPRPGARIRRSRDVGGARPEVPEQLGEQDLPKGAPALRHRRCAPARHQVRSDRGGGGLHRRAGDAPGGDPGNGGHHGHRAHGGTGHRAGQAGQSV